MASSLAYNALCNPDFVFRQRVANFIFMTSTSATLGLQIWVFFVNGKLKFILSLARYIILLISKM